MREYEKLLKTRSENIYGVGPWYWIAEDNGAWDGPNKDWATHIEWYRKQVKKWDVVVQAGGCQGMYPRLFSDHFKRVYTFEPDPLNFLVLVNNCQKDNIYKMQAALGEKPDLIKVTRNYKTNVGMNTVTGPGYIPQVTIDSLDLDACDLIQLDLEGYEARALMGAKTTIQRYQPIIACENGSDVLLTILNDYSSYEVAGKSVMDTIYIPKGK